ncbi:hypothetical protein APT63_19265 [Pseudomonas sp. 22-AL-CL-001]|nr:hypothetical protein APT63_19265 [Pseudomonas monteilii]
MVAERHINMPRSLTKPKISDQLISMDKRILCLRNPWIEDSAFMGKLYCSWALISFIGLPAILLHDSDFDPFLIYLSLASLSVPLMLALFLLYRIYLLKTLSHFFFDRELQVITTWRGKKPFVCQWKDAELYPSARVGFNGAGIGTAQSLVIRDTANPSKGLLDIFIWIDGNTASTPDASNVLSVQAYIEHFMDHGPEGLPPPAEGNWGQVPNQRIYLTPREALRHYVPWRTGEPWEEQLKYNGLLPVWCVLFPWNLYGALCWYATCRLFNLRQAPAWAPDTVYCPAER